MNGLFPYFLASAAKYPYAIPFSCNFDTAFDRLARTPGSAGNKKKYTISTWFSPSTGRTTCFLSGGNTTNDFTYAYYDQSVDKIGFAHCATSYLISVATSALGCSVGSWYHVLVAVDTDNGTQADRVKVYLNNASKSLSGTLSPSGQSTYINDTKVHNMGSYINGNLAGYGYLAEHYVIDGYALTPSSFGQLSPADGTTWVPKQPTGLTYGTCGTYVNFSNSAAMGTDSSGNGNNFSLVGIDSSNQSTFTPTNP